MSPRLGHLCTWPWDIQIRLKVKGQGHSRQWPENLVNEHRISQTNEGNLT